jgi:hypothetical protein
MRRPEDEHVNRKVAPGWGRGASHNAFAGRAHVRSLRSDLVNPPSTPLSWEHAFVTAQGTPLTRFRRAIEGRSILLAELAAREGGRLPLEDAVALSARCTRGSMTTSSSGRRSGGWPGMRSSGGHRWANCS